MQLILIALICHVVICAVGSAMHPSNKCGQIYKLSYHPGAPVAPSMISTIKQLVNKYQNQYVSMVVTSS